MLYTKAGTRFDRRDFAGAKETIEAAERVLGETLNKPGMFEFHLRAANIYNEVGETTKAANFLDRAVEAISLMKNINDVDRRYLLDYCDHFMSDILADGSRGVYRIHESEYSMVKPRYLSNYPLTWLK